MFKVQKFKVEFGLTAGYQHPPKYPKQHEALNLKL
jgi:hypothetical protein